MTLAPKLSQDIAFERPIDQGPSPFMAVAAAVTGLTTSALATRQPPSEAELKNQNLQPYVQRLNELKDSDMSDAEFTRQARVLTRQTLAQFPTYRTDITGIAKEAFGFEAAETLQTTPTDAINEQYNQFLQTPEGVMALARGAVAGRTPGTVDFEASQQGAQAEFLRVQAEEADLAATNRRLSSLEGDEKILLTEGRLAMESFASNKLAEAQKELNGFMLLATTADPSVDTPEEQIAWLRNARSIKLGDTREKALAAGIPQSIINERIEEVVAPYDQLIQDFEAGVSDTDRLLDAYRNTQQLGLEQRFVETFGPIGADPEWRKIQYEVATADSLTRENAARMMDVMEEMTTNGQTNAFQFIPELPTSNAGSAVEPGETTRPELVQRYRDRAAEDETYLPAQVNTSTVMITTGDATNAEGQRQILMGVSNLNTAAEAWGGAMGEELLRSSLSPQALDNIRVAIQQGGSQGERIKNQMSSLIGQQLQHQHRIMESLRTSGVVFQGVRYRAELRGDKYVVVDENGRVQPRVVNRRGRGARGQAAFEAVDNMNFLLSASRAIDPDVKKAADGVRTMIDRGMEVDTDALREYLDGDIRLEDIENLQNTSARMDTSPRDFMFAIARTESSGDYTATNDIEGSGGKGHFGLVQFSRGRLQEAKAAGMMPSDMTPEEFASPGNEHIQEAVGVWHFKDIDEFIDDNNLLEGGWDRNGLRAVAHLGGKGGMARFVETNGEHNPADAFGTSLLDYYNEYSGQNLSPAPLPGNLSGRTNAPPPRPTAAPEASPRPVARGGGASFAGATTRNIGTAGVDTTMASVDEGDRSASRAATRDAEVEAMAALARLGVRSFDTQEALAQAVEAGDVQANEIVIVGGMPQRVGAS